MYKMFHLVNECLLSPHSVSGLCCGREGRNGCALSTQNAVFSFPVPARVLEIPGPAAMTFGPVAPVRKNHSAGSKPDAYCQRGPRPPPPLSAFLFLKDLEDCS